MFRKKRSISLFLVLILAISVLLTACGDKGGNGGNEPNGGAGQQEPGGEVKPVVVRFGHNQPVDSPEHAGALKFKEVAEEISNGKVQIDIYPAQQLGSLREQVEGTQLGTIDISMQPSAVISPFVDDIKICDLPYLWPKDREAMFKVLDSDTGIELLDRLEQGGFKGLGYWFGGYKLFTTKNKPIRLPSDFKGVKMRVMEAPILLSQYKAWGGNPIDVPYAELYNALQQGIVDGQENPLQTIYLNNYQEVQKEIIQSYHGAMMYIMIANKGWFDGLPADIQEIIQEAEYEGRLEARRAFAAVEADYIEKLKAIDTVNYYELTDAEIEEFTKASLPVHEEHTAGWQKEYLEKLYKALEEAAK